MSLLNMLLDHVVATRQSVNQAICELAKFAKKHSMYS